MNTELNVTNWRVPCMKPVEGSKTLVAVSHVAPFVVVAGGHQPWKLLHAGNGEVHMSGRSHDGTGECTCELEVSPTTGEITVDEKCPVVAHNSEIRSMDFCGKLNVFATGDRGGNLIVWDTESGRVEMKTIIHADCSVESLCFTPNGVYLASATSYEKELVIYVWSWRGGRVFRRIKWKYNEMDTSSLNLSFSSTGEVLACSGPGENLRGDIYLWDIFTNNNQKINEENMHGFAQFSTVHADECATVASELSMVGIVSNVIEATDQLHTNDFSSAVELHKMQFADHVFAGQQLKFMRFSPDGSLLAVSSEEGICCIWSTDSREVKNRVDVHGEISSFSWGPDWVKVFKDDEYAKKKCISFGMCQHKRLGVRSRAHELDLEIVNMILHSLREAQLREAEVLEAQRRQAMSRL